MTKPIRAVLYVRISASDDDSTSIARQEADLREIAAREGWDVIEPPLVDDGISGRKARANATEALRMIADGEADVLAVWKFDRWTRQGLSAVGVLADTLKDAPGSLFVSLRDGLRSDQPAFGIIASVLAEVAKMEAENTSARVRSSISHLKTVGRFHGGVVPFGYDAIPNPDGPGRVLVLNAAEAAIVREIAERLCRGESTTKLALDLTARGVPTVRSDYRRALKTGRPAEGLDRGHWLGGTIQKTWTSAHLLGYVLHRGEYVRGEDGLRLRVWPAVIDFETRERVLARLRNPGTTEGKRSRRKRAARLLSGLAFCAGCGARMHIGMSRGVPMYACPNDLDRRCERPRMTAANAERIVVERFLAIVGSHPELEIVQLVGDPGVSEELAEIEAGLREASTELLRDDADSAALFARIGALKARRAELSSASAEIREVGRPTGRTYAEAWDAAELDERRRLLGSAMDHVAIRKLRPEEPRKGLHRDRVAIVWADELAEVEAA
ncbi:recombinase family protein [Agromyces mariniharenae]|uniref:Recombinase family protein n=1 Tax=Agromyces mariniharenae TaxID=2604423 RepID=A0A5S4UWU1_9MICO|nr:recombinase family protein [Agromyces mariniharenae]TYL51036.1 hypothetical protein FYC51_18060 [Agromyces mariniharenae]